MLTLPDLSLLSLVDKTKPVDGRYDDADPAESTIAAFLDGGAWAEAVDDLQEVPGGGVRMSAKNPEPGHEVKSELFRLSGLFNTAAGTNHGGRFWLECVECKVIHDDEGKKGKVKRVVILSFHSEGSMGSYSKKDFDGALERIAPGFKPPLTFKADVNGKLTAINNPWGTRPNMIKSLALTANQMLLQAVSPDTEPDTDDDQ